MTTPAPDGAALRDGPAPDDAERQRDPAPDAADVDLLHAVAALFAPQTPDKIGIAVSGGSDSMALLHLMAQAAPPGVALHAVTVDHGLRPEAADEARFVAAACGQIGLPHTTLHWQRDATGGNLQDQARRARYALIAAWARGQGIGQMALGHTADDNAETFLMGLGRAAGLDGLCGMRPHWQDHGIHWHRPLLDHSRVALRLYLGRRGVGWVDDPSNDNDRFTRVKARRVMAALAPLGITADRLGGVMAHLAGARAALDLAAQAAFHGGGQEMAGSLLLDRAQLAGLSPEVNRRLLLAALKWVAGAEHAPRGPALARVLAAVAAGRDATLAGCRLRLTATQLRILREPKALAGVTSATERLWDNRWHLDGPHAEGLSVRALGSDGLRQCKNWRDTGLPRDVLLVTPAVWWGETLVSAPVAGFENGWKARIVTGFASFVLSH